MFLQACGLILSHCAGFAKQAEEFNSTDRSLGRKNHKTKANTQTHRSCESDFFFANLPRWKCISWSCSAASSWPCQMLADIIDITGSKLLRQSQNGRNPCNSDGFPLVFPEIFLNFDFSDLFFALYLRLFSVQLQRGQCGTAA